LDALWADLGIVLKQGHGGAELSFDDGAPLASLRKRITEPH
jgi:hypothetical protein